jgi:uncharacterized membrane protein YuzA (DUF378 family)
MMHRCKGGCAVGKLAGLLMVVGGLNWGLVGIGMFMNNNFNVVNLLLGRWPVVEAIVYIVVGIATVVSLMGCKCAKCKASCASCQA